MHDVFIGSLFDIDQYHLEWFFFWGLTISYGNSTVFICRIGLRQFFFGGFIFTNNI
ncbi:hypothetical protein BCR42DRAFT_426242, partial [Absidia repens]